MSSSESDSESSSSSSSEEQTSSEQESSSSSSESEPSESSSSYEQSESSDSGEPEPEPPKSETAPPGEVSSRSAEIVKTEAITIGAGTLGKAQPRVKLVLKMPGDLTFGSMPQVTLSTVVDLSASDSMQEAFAQAKAGTQFRAKEGEYREELKAKQDVSIVGIGNVDIYNHAEAPVMTVEAGTVYVKDVSFKQTSVNFAAVEVLSGNVIFDKCVFYSRGANTVSIRGDAKVFLINCTVNGSDASALCCNGNAEVQCHNSVFQNSRSNGVILSGSSATLLNQCEIKDCDESGLYISSAARFYMVKSKITNVKIGVRSISKGEYQLISEVGMTGVKKSCIITGDAAMISLFTSKFCECSGPVLKCMEKSSIKMQQCQTLTQLRTKMMSLRGDARIETTGDSLSGIIKLKENAHLVLLKNVLQSCTLTLKGGCTAEVDNCDFVKSDRNVISATENSNVYVYSSSFQQTYGFFIRTKGKFVAANCQFVGCDMAMDVGGAEDCEITSCDISKSKRYGVYLHSAKASVSHCRISQCGFAALEIVNSWATVKACTLLENAGGVCLKQKSNVGFSDGFVSRNRTFGALAEPDTTLSISESQFSEQPERGIVACGKVTMTTVKVNKQGLIGIQVEGGKGIIIGEKCEICDNGCGILAAQEGKVKLTQCSLVTNGMQFEARANVIALLKDVTMKNSKEGVGVYVHDLATVTLNHCLIDGDATCGLVVGSQVNMDRTQIVNCKDGLIFLGQASGRVEASVFDRNKNDGIRILGGTPVVTDCTISNNGNYGVVIKGGDPEVQNNDFQNNAKGNVSQ